MTIHTKVNILRETTLSFIVTCEDGPSTSAGPSQLRIAKKHILKGSYKDLLPDADKEEAKDIDYGTLVLPDWVATQLCIWKREEDSEDK